MLIVPGSRAGRGVYNRDRPPRTKVRLTTNMSLNHDVWTTVAWNSVVQDDVNAWNPNAPKLITPPPGFSLVKVSLAINFNANLNTGALLAICKNGTDAIANAVRMDLCPAGFEMNRTLRSDHIDFVAGDFFYIMVDITTALGANGGLSGSTFPGPSSAEFRWFR